MPAAWLRDAGTAKGQRMESPPALRGQAGPRVLTSVLKNVMEDFKIWLLSGPKQALKSGKKPSIKYLGFSPLFVMWSTTYCTLKWKMMSKSKFEIF